MNTTDIKCVACVGGGVIGSSWAIQFAMRGLDVVLYDINDEQLAKSEAQMHKSLDALEQFGVKAEYDGARVFRVPGNQYYQHRDLAIEADWSNAAFWYGAASLGCQVDIRGLNACSVQGDMRIVPYFVKLQGEGLVDLDVSQCPDLVPPLAAMAALRGGAVTRIVNAGRLRIKESDRLATVTEVLNALGADVEEHEDQAIYDYFHKEG